MIQIVEDWNAPRHSDLLAQVFRMRARIFSGKLGWDVDVNDGEERDRFDDESPIYIISTDQYNRVNGSLRLLPTTGPTLLGEVFRDTIPEAALLSAPAIWECTRFCVDHKVDNPLASSEVLFVSGVLVAAVGRLGMKSGVDTILGNFDASMLRVYRRLGCRVDVIGSTDFFGRTVYLGRFSISRASVDAVERRIRPLDKERMDLLAA